MRCGGLSTPPPDLPDRRWISFVPIWLDLDPDLTREGLRHLYALGVDPLHIVDSLSQCSASVQWSSANAAILVSLPESTDAHHQILAVLTAIGPNLGLCVLLRESRVDREVELLAEGADIVPPLDGECIRKYARLAAFTRCLQETEIKSFSNHQDVTSVRLISVLS